MGKGVQEIMATNISYLMAKAEMREKGMVTLGELGEIWGGMCYNSVKHYKRSGRLPRGEYHEKAKTFFYPADTAMPAGMDRGPKKISKPSRLKGVAMKERMFYRGDSIPPGSEQVPLETAWAMWKAPGWVRFGKIRHMVSGKASMGWLGGLSN